MRIAHVNKYYYGRGGADQYMISLMKLLESRGHVTAPFSMHHPKNMDTPWKDFFVSEMDTASDSTSVLRKISYARRVFWSREAYQKAGLFFDTFRPDILHVHNIYTQLSPSVLKAAKERGIPVVMTVHDYHLLSANYSYWSGDDALPLRPLGLFETARTRSIKDSFLATLIMELIVRAQRLLGLYDRRIDRYLVGSKFLEDVMVQGGYSQKKIMRVPLFGRLNCSDVVREDKGYALYFGRLEFYKGVQVLLDAVKKRANIRVKIAGTGSYDRGLRRKAQNMKHVEFLGYLEGADLCRTIKEATVVVMPSLVSETFGLSVLEAQSLGVPVVVSDRGALPELVEHGVTGTVVPANNPVALQAELEKYMYNADFVNEMGGRAEKRVKEIGGEKEHLDRIVSIYKEVIKETF